MAELLSPGRHKQLRWWLVTIVFVHAAVAAWHGVAHTKVPVPLSHLQTAFVVVVITLAPLVGVAMLWTARKREGALLIAISMLASLIFGVVKHYVLDSPDHVTQIPEHAWRHAFVLSAALVAVTETAAAVLGAVAAYVWRRV